MAPIYVRTALQGDPSSDTLAPTFPRSLITPDRVRFPLSVIMLALSVSGWAQSVAPSVEAAPTTVKTTTAVDSSLAPVIVKGQAETVQGRESLRATTTTIGKGKQQLRDIPQSVTVVTEKLINDRNLDTLKDVLHNTAGVTFQAAEGGEEDIRLRGFSLAATGDIFSDGLRDPAFYDRDTFNNDRIELLRGSASMLFGRGSTGGAVNQVSKQPMLLNENEVTFTAGSHNYLRAVGDFNIKTDDNAAVRITAMRTKADNNGFGNSIDKQGMAVSYGLGIGTADEFTASIYALENKNGINYGIPWIRRNANSTAADTTIIRGLDPSNYYGAASDKNEGSATYATLSHIHRFQTGSELKTVLRAGHYDRDQRASAVRFVDANTNLSNLNNNTALRRGSNNKIQDMNTVYFQSDYSGKFDALGVKHSLLAGVDYANEKFNNYNATLPTGVATAKPNTIIGAPDDGGSFNESLRILSLGRNFNADALGVYAQDMIQLAPAWKVLFGLRHDSFKGQYQAAATGTAQALALSRSDNLWSKRFGVLYQPTALSSFHFSYGTSFNTSGDTYQYDTQTANTPPEGSENLELGAKIDSENQRMTTRLALFRSTKTNERNRDPDSAAQFNLLSGKRHTAGIEIDMTGRITKEWEIYGSYAWTPIATIDVGAPGSIAGVGEGKGTRSSLTPRHSGTVWSTYQLTQHFRFGGGLNFRGEQTPNRNPGWSAPAFVTADLMAEYTFDRYAIKANIINVANKLYADSLYTGHYVPGSGRNIQVALSTKF